MSSCSHDSACSAWDLGSIPVLGRSPGEGKGYPLQYSDLENCMDCVVHGVTKSWTQLSDFHFISLQFSYYLGVQLSCGFYFKVQWNAEINALQYLSVSKRFHTTCLGTRSVKFC